MESPITSIPFRFISSWSRFCEPGGGSEIPFGLANPGSNTWCVANKALFLPLELPWPFNVQRFFCLNGATASGTWDIGIFSLDGYRICSAAHSNGDVAITQAGTNAIQYAVCSPDVILPPGYYYLAMSASATSLTVYGGAAFAPVTAHRRLGLVQAVTSHPLPANVTLAAVSGNIQFPEFGITSTSTGF